MSAATAIFLVLFAAFLWGSWLQARKYTGDFPLPSFMIWLYFASLVLVWGVILVNELVNPVHIFTAIRSSPGLAAVVCLCGASMAIGMQLQMSVIDKVGLILSNSVSATCGVLLGTLLTVMLGGLPENVSVGMIFFSAFVLIIATLVCQFSGKLRDKDLSKASSRPAKTQDSKAALLLVLSSLLVAAYPLGMSLGVKTKFSDGGFPPLVCVGLLAFGSFAGTMIYSAFFLSKNKQWKTLFSKKYKKAILISSFCGLCHYGGNLIHVISSHALSVAVSWLIGRTANMWTYLWGIYHKEYQGAKSRTYAVLVCGIAIYVIGILLLSRSFYR
ncbi:hypothetical protein [Breznakiella homolactica]|uniref:Uncharacterized protein n=1 Tax=Breznakiella homolactica TaxID=2798577 RepID=A0A7T7XN89_9SPIR|nr:hypothetical protein [Breznakiella homolactica]QQO09372.1 hypothetical protein JFL75_00165 [Breznakiella homolactica]